MRYPVTFTYYYNGINKLRGNGSGNAAVTPGPEPVTPPVREPKDVELLLRWAYQVELAALSDDRGIEAELSRLGVRAVDWSRPIVDGGGPMRSCAVLNGDAEMVHQVVRALGLSRVVIPHALTGGRPQWNVGGPLRCHPIWEFDRRGRRYMAMEFDSAGRPIACKLGFEGDDARAVEAARHGWIDWWEALTSIRDALDGRLRRFHPTGPAAPVQPWNDVVERTPGAVAKKVIDLAQAS